MVKEESDEDGGGRDERSEASLGEGGWLLVECWRIGSNLEEDKPT